MATKKQPATKKVTAKASTSKKKSASSRRITAAAIYKERHPERHQATGKYKFFYVLFVCTTIFFAATSVWLFVFATETLNKYESIESCVRAHTRCNISAEDGEIKAEEAK